MQPDLKVGQPKTKPNIESRLSALESKIDKLIELNFQNNEPTNNKSPKEDGLGRIQTGDLRRVKAMPLLAPVRSFKSKPQKMMPV